MEAFQKKKEFNMREEILGQEITTYNDLDSLAVDFKPFYDLIIMSYQIKNDLAEWISGQLMKQDT